MLSRARSLASSSSGVDPHESGSERSGGDVAYKKITEPTWKTYSYLQLLDYIDSTAVGIHRVYLTKVYHEQVISVIILSRAVILKSTWLIPL